MRSWRLIITAFILIGCVPQLMSAQDDFSDKRGALKGRLEDYYGSSMPGALIQLYTWSGDYVGSAESGPDGLFRFSGVNSGVYTLRVEYHGQRFTSTISKTNSESPIEVRVGDQQASRKRSLQPRVSVNDLQVPDLAKKKFGKATKALRDNNQNLALRFINEAIMAAPRWGQAYFFRGVLFMQNRLYPQAERDFTTAVTVNPADGSALAALGAVYIREKQYQKAEFYLNRATGVIPVVWQAYFEMAKLRFEQAKYAEAAKLAGEAAGADAEAGPECHLLAAEAQIGLQNYAAAASDLTRYLSSKPKGKVADQARAQLAEIQRAFAQARSAAAGTPAAPRVPAVAAGRPTASATANSVSSAPSAQAVSAPAASAPATSVPAASAPAVPAPAASTLVSSR